MKQNNFVRKNITVIKKIYYFKVTEKEGEVCQNYPK